jgi:Protein of unknown function (DUF1566)
VKEFNNPVSISTLLSILLLNGCGGSDGGVSPVFGNATGLIPDTGQSSCYYDATIDGFYNPTAFTCLGPDSVWQPAGQDGYYNNNAMSFTDNGNGTIRDNITLLTWQKCSFGMSGSDCSAGAINSSNWTTALNQCATLNLAGTGWRLPTVFELTQLVDYGESYTAIDQAAFPGTGASAYWTATQHANQTSWAWYVSFAQGNTYAHEKTQTFYVRCVRG